MHGACVVSARRWLRPSGPALGSAAELVTTEEASPANLGPQAMSFDSIVVFSDPLGPGVDARTAVDCL